MLNKTTICRQVLLCSLAVGGMVLSSCSKDEGYDLENIDGTVGITVQEFTIPGINSTMNIPLNDLFDIEDNEIISTNADGDYIFEKASADGDINPAQPSVDPINVTNGASPDFQVKIGALDQIRTVTEGVPDALFDAAFDAAWLAVPDNLEASDVISLLNYERELPDDVLMLKQVVTDNGNGQSTIRVHLEASGTLSQILSNISKIEVTLPTFLSVAVTDGNGNNCPVSDGVVTLTNVSPRGVDLTISIQGLTDFKTQDQVQPSDENYLVVRPKDGTAKRELVLHGMAKAKLTISRDNDLVKDNLKSVLRSTSADPAFQLNASTTLSEIAIVYASGQFAPNIDLGEIGGMAITGLPDFLDGDNVRLVVANPQIYLDLTSDLDLDGVINNVKLVAKGNRLTTADNQRIVEIPDGQIKAMRNTKSSYVIFDAGNENNLTPPEGRNLSEFTRISLSGTVDVQARDGSALQVGKLASLLYEIPDSIKFTASGTTTDAEGSIQLGRQYNILPAYAFKAPLALNKGSYVIYNDSIDGWREDLEDLTLKGQALVQVTTDVENQVPLALTLDVTPKFTEGTPEYIKNKVTVNVNKTIAPKSTTNGVIITLVVADKEAFEHLDGLKFNALAESFTEGQIETLKKQGHTLKFNNIGAKVSGTFVIED